jgi:hypothetical protein
MFPCAHVEVGLKQDEECIEKYEEICQNSVRINETISCYG